MKIKIYADGADLPTMLANSGRVGGFTTNPTLMRKAGITNYQLFAKEVLTQITHLPISFEVLSDELPEMERQARILASWGKNVYVKIPVSTTRRISTGPIIRDLSREGIKVNVTAVFTVKQVEEILGCLDQVTPCIISIFCGRIANAGVDPIPIVKEAVAMSRHMPQCEILWASTREPFNVIQAEQCGCHIITVTQDILSTLATFGKDLDEYSLETVKMFYDDAQAAGFSV